MCRKNYQYHYLLALGSNVGNKEKNFTDALWKLQKQAGVVIHQRSQWIITDPLPSPLWDTHDHDVYLNGVVWASTLLPPSRLYEVIRNIEDSLGHPRERRWLPRAMDIDILICGIGSDEQTWQNFIPLFQDTPDLHIPHEGCANRAFLHTLIFEHLSLSPETFKRYLTSQCIVQQICE